GLTGRLPENEQVARRLARSGYIVLAPFFTQRRAFSEPWLEDRMWLMRLGYQTGRPIAGRAVIQIGSILEFLCALPCGGPGGLGIVGNGRGGMTALFAAAIGPRLRVALSAGYLDDSRPDWEQPEDRMLWKIRSYFSNDDLAALTRPRILYT